MGIGVDNRIRRFFRKDFTKYNFPKKGFGFFFYEYMPGKKVVITKRKEFSSLWAVQKVLPLSGSVEKTNYPIATPVDHIPTLNNHNARLVLVEPKDTCHPPIRPPDRDAGT